jgi:ABC-type transport system substrate-binding protein
LFVYAKNTSNEVNVYALVYLRKIEMNQFFGCLVMKNKKLLLLVPLFLMVLVSFKPVDAVATAHDTLVLQVEEEILHLDNRWSGRSSAYDAAVCNQIWGYLGMIAPGETIVTMPGIAESWEWNAEMNEVTFTLRNNLTFHDGSPITAADIEYSWKNGFYVYNYLDNMTDPAWTGEFNFTYASDDALEFTVSSTTNWPDPMEEFDFCGQWAIKAIIPEGSMDTEQQELDFDRMPVSCGPYMLAKESDWATEDYVLLTRFDEWYGWGETFTDSNGDTWTFPEVDEAFKYLKFRIIPEKAMALVELRTYGIDVTTGRFSDIDSFDQTVAADGFDGYQVAVLGGATMNINHQGDWPSYFDGPGNFPCSETWFRRALSHTIDRSNIVDNVYLGVADERNEVFSDWILDKFPNLDTTDFYDFSTNATLAEEILDDSGYEALGFADEPDNRFGWGLYKNETEINSVTQTKGYHFTLTTMDCDFCVKRVLAIKKDLAELGIYVDAELLEWGSYLDKIYAGDPGLNYNTSLAPDPDYNGPPYDFSVGGFGGNYETPWDFIAYRAFPYWLYYGYGSYSWYNEDYETGYAKTTGGEPGFGLLGITPEGMPEGGYPVPAWSNDDAQFIAGAQQAGKAIADEVPSIPLVWYTDTFAYNEKLTNFIAARNSMYHCAYATWDEGDETETGPEGPAPGFEAFILLAAFGASAFLLRKRE